MKRWLSGPGQLTVLRSLHFVNYATMVLVVTYFPLYFYDIGFTKLQIGAIFSIGPLLSIFSNLLAGVAADKSKALRRVLSLIFLGQIFALALLLPQKEFGVVSVLMGVFYFFQTPVNSMMDSVTLLAAEKLNRSFSAIRMFGSLGFAVCAILFGFLLKASGSDLTLWIALITVLCSLVLSFALGDFQKSATPFRFGSLWSVLKRRETLVFFGLVALVSVSHRMNDGFLAVTMKEFGASESLIGASSLASSLSEIPMFFLLSKYGHRFKELPLLAFASLMYALRMVLLSISNEPIAFVAIQTMHSVTFGIYYITALRYLQSIVPDEYRSSGQALFGMVWTGLAGLIAGTLGGWLYDAYDHAAVFRLGGVFAFMAVVGFLAVHLRRSKA
ncbi:MFS transporter [Cohnella thailandensis]|uniref:MFS transporter n=1 Tax=Cohnella thailandensis TaxID=557557 RepID=A0A841SSM6_9BACL|nr:MFS transporter [Cohnella thailandensis]MBB6633979.1 MFS transporter [Cohnella thailandensis]MBP1972662.1 PPP family 3-phenylpropionic acid transporter [Cohnella thailandensis]